jgi:cyclase
VLKTRVMPCLLLRNRALVKTIRFEKPSYVGDPINTVRIYNELEVDELIFLDITATVDDKRPQLELIQEIAGECFMPFAYGGGVRTIDEMAAIFASGAEKVAVNSEAVDNPALIETAAARFGSQAIVASIDARKGRLRGYSVHTRGGRKDAKVDPVTHARNVERLGAGEILLTSIDRDGTMEGYDLDLVREVSAAVRIPVVACGGAGSVADFAAAKRSGASAVAAGSLVVYQGRNRSVLINFPSKPELRAALG